MTGAKGHRHDWESIGAGSNWSRAWCKNCGALHTMTILGETWRVGGEPRLQLSEPPCRPVARAKGRTR